MTNEKAEFDDFAVGFNESLIEHLGVFAKFRQSMLYYKMQYIKYFLPETPSAILDYGCGIGLNAPYLREYFPDAELFGCDVSGKSISLAKENFKSCTFNTIIDVNDLKIYKNKIDCVFISCVLHHIPFNEHEKWLYGLRDILKEGGHIVVFEMNMNNPLSKRLVKNTPCDKNANMLDTRYCKNLMKKIFGEAAPVRLSYTYFFPWRNEVFTWLEHRLLWLPLGAQYCVTVQKRSGLPV
ncbi:MAG: methyltransferase domain-containing protein [Spirochaetaceae bacterium]|jgi:ubiquinone/menaquinone biosynthesis C-methylase UbiE|nr:methyltransferase domain-containing protein [Spirochaetaceae bacterium]